MDAELEALVEKFKDDFQDATMELSELEFYQKLKLHALTIVDFAEGHIIELQRKTMKQY